MSSAADVADMSAACRTGSLFVEVEADTCSSLHTVRAPRKTNASVTKSFVRHGSRHQPRKFSLWAGGGAWSGLVWPGVAFLLSHNPESAHSHSPLVL